MRCAREFAGRPARMEGLKYDPDVWIDCRPADGAGAVCVYLLAGEQLCQPEAEVPPRLSAGAERATLREPARLELRVPRRQVSGRGLRGAAGAAGERGRDADFGD